MAHRDTANNSYSMQNWYSKKTASTLSICVFILVLLSE